MAETVKVRFTRTYKGTDGVSIAAGTVATLPRDIARKLIAEGKAEKVKEPKR